MKDEGQESDDMFCIGNSYSYNELKISLGTKANIHFTGDVSWIPEQSDQFNIVDNWSTEEIKDAGGLKASNTFDEIVKFYFVFSRQPFIHSWDLSTNQQILNVVKKVLFKAYPKTNDKDLFIDALNGIFTDEIYSDIKEKIKFDWFSQI